LYKLFTYRVLQGNMTEAYIIHDKIEQLEEE
jgi:hypothetical protein